MTPTDLAGLVDADYPAARPVREPGRGAERPTRRVRRALVCLVLLGLGAATVGQAYGQAAEGDGRSPATCAPGDPNPEPGLQGQVPQGATPAWDCGVRAVGFLPEAEGALAVAGHCAYVGGGLPDGSGVRVLDVSEPAKPRQVRVLPTSSRELLAARVTPQRSILVTRRRDTQAQDGQVIGRDILVDVWNIKTCTDPKLLGTLRFPTANPTFGDFSQPVADSQGPAHNLGLNPSATKVYGTIPLQEGDITDLAHPERWTVRDLNCEVAKQANLYFQVPVPVCESTENTVPGPQLGSNSHEPTFSPDGSRLYIGGQAPPPYGNDMYVLDMTAKDPRLISVTKDAPGHSIDVVTVKNRRYLLHSNELSPGGCLPDGRPQYVFLGDRAFLLDITDETAPQKGAELVLEESRLGNCGREGNTARASIAYHAVDNALDSTYAVIGYGVPGFRFFDLREPTRPIEVAYFNHGATEHTKPYIIPETGHIWVSGAGGFWVLELEPHVRKQLGLAPGGKAAPVARPGSGATSAGPGPGTTTSELPATGGAVAPVAGFALVIASLAVLRIRRRCRAA